MYLIPKFDLFDSNFPLVVMLYIYRIIYIYILAVYCCFKHHCVTG